MSLLRCLDLSDYGLRLVAAGDARFAGLVDDIVQRTPSFASWPTGDIGRGAVLLNESRKAVVAVAHVWTYIKADGTRRTHYCSNLGSSLQMEILAGRSPAPEDLGTCILAGSKRLITERGIFGNNLDVLPGDSVPARGVYGGGGGIGSGSHNEQAVGTELRLDLAIFDDGLCAGSDTFGLFTSLTESLEIQHRTAEKAVEALRGGASEGQVFEILAPLARGRHSTSAARQEAALLSMFGRTAINQMINRSAQDFLEWLEPMAKPRLTLRHPT